MPTYTAAQIARILGRGKESRTPTGWVTTCPAHQDDEPSLSVSDQSDGKLLVRCHAGCPQDQVITALKDLDLWPRYNPAKWRVISPIPDGTPLPEGLAHSKYGLPSKHWTYRNIDGKIVGYVFRFDKPQGGKEILPVSYCCTDEGKFGWRFKSFLKPRPLYWCFNLKDRPSAPVIVVEGEKTADAAREIFQSYVIVTWPGGSSAAKFADWDVLKDRDVILWPDADEPGIKAMNSIGEILQKSNCASVKMVQLPKDLSKGWDLADDPEGHDPVEILQTAKDFRPAGDPVVDELNQYMALTLLGDKAAVIWERWDPIKKRHVTSYVSIPALRAKYANQTVPSGRKMVPVIDYWLTHPYRRSYDGVVFEPGVDTPNYYNLWRGFTYEPDPGGDWSLLDDHLKKDVAQGDESLYRWILAWFAQMCQDPHNKPGTSLTIRGRQGVGKSVIGEHIGALLRDNYVHVDDSRYVVGNFNTHMASALLLHADEGFFAGDPRHVGRLKGLVTAHTNRIEPKGKESFEVHNYMRLFITSNELWVVPASFEERRFAVIDCGEQHLQDREYFKEMDRQLKSGGYEGLLYHLLNMDISDIDVGVVPKTTALMSQKTLSFDPIERFWFECLVDGYITEDYHEWPEFIGTTKIYNEFIERAVKWGVPRRPGKIQFTQALREMLPGRELKKVQKYMNGFDHDTVRVWSWELPPLDECREWFDKEIGSLQDWGDPYNETDDIPF